MNQDRDRLEHELLLAIGALATERAMPLIDEAMKTYTARFLAEASCNHVQDVHGKCSVSSCSNSLPL